MYIGKVQSEACRSNVWAKEASISRQMRIDKTKIIMKISANKSKKPFRVHAAGKI